MGKKQVLVGIDQDVSFIRGVRLSSDGSGKGPSSWKLLSFDEVEGDLGDPAKAAVTLKKLKDKLGIQAGDVISTCLSGKQTYAVQMDVRKLPDDEMYGMLRLELRKSMPFEASVASFDFQFLPVASDVKKDASVPVMVSAVSNAFLAKRLQLLESAGLKAHHVSVLPVAIANAFWATKAAADSQTHVLLHIGAETCTLVIDGPSTPFFTRSFSFSANELTSTKEGGTEATSQAVLQMNILSSELTKSITYYKNTNQGSGNVTSIMVLGSYATHPAFDMLGQKTGYTVQTIQTSHAVQSSRPPAAGKYDLAIALAMQAAD